MVSHKAHNLKTTVRFGPPQHFDSLRSLSVDHFDFPAINIEENEVNITYSEEKCPDLSCPEFIEGVEGLF